MLWSTVFKRHSSQREGGMSDYVYVLRVWHACFCLWGGGHGRCSWVKSAADAYEWLAAVRGFSRNRVMLSARKYLMFLHAQMWKSCLLTELRGREYVSFFFFFFISPLCFGGVETWIGNISESENMLTYLLICRGIVYFCLNSNDVNSYHLPNWGISKWLSEDVYV